MSTLHYEPADTITRGDILPDVSRYPVARVITIPHEGVRVTFAGTSFTRYFSYGGPDFGYPAVRIERP